MGLKLITPPPVKPLTRTDAYVQCQIDTVTAGSPPVTTSSHDAWIDLVIPVVTREAESASKRALVTQTWELWLDHFPCLDPASYSPHHTRRDKAIVVPLPPLQSVESIKYLDEDDVEQTLDPTLYTVDDSEEPARIVPKRGTLWPRTCSHPGTVKVRFTCGYAPTYTGSPPEVESYTANIPEDVKHWMLLHMAHWFRNREATWQITNTAVVAELPYVNDLIGAKRVYP